MNREKGELYMSQAHDFLDKLEDHQNEAAEDSRVAIKGAKSMDIPFSVTMERANRRPKVQSHGKN